MPYEDEDPPFVEPDVELNQIVTLFIGAAIEIHRRLGAGLDEKLYCNALCIELRRRNIPFSTEISIPVTYKDEAIGEKRVDFIIGNRLIVEIKAVECLTSLHSAQLRTYLKITNSKLGLPINFNVPILKDGIKRIINPSAH